MSLKKLTPRHIVLIRTDRFGDLLMTLPMVRRLRSNFPGALITVLCTQINEPLLHYHLDITNIQTVDGDHLKFHNLAKFIRQLRSLKADCVIMPQSHKLYHLSAFLAGVKTRIGFKRKWGFLLTQSIPDTKAASGLHEIDSNMQLLDLICEKKWDRQTDLGFEMCEEYPAVLNKLRIRSEKIKIAFHMSSSNPVKQWPINSFKKVIDEFLKRQRYQVILIGAEESEEMKEKLSFDGNPQVINLLGKTNFKELAIVLRAVDCLVSLDSGPFHLAWMQKTSVVGIFLKDAAGSNPIRWGVYPDLVLNRQFYDVAQRITPQMIVDAVQEIISIKKKESK